MPQLNHAAEEERTESTQLRVHVYITYNRLQTEKNQLSPQTEVINFLKPRSHSAGMATVHPGGGQPVYRDEPGHFS